MNKILSYFTMLLLSAMTLTLGSCTEEYEYSAEAAKGQQVYFSNTLASTVTITNDGAHFLVPISRVNTDEELTVNITATDESGQLTIPQSVTFEAGQSEANITIDYDPNQITADTYYDVTLSIADADYTTPYGEFFLFIQRSNVASLHRDWNRYVYRRLYWSVQCSGRNQAN